MRRVLLLALLASGAAGCASTQPETAPGTAPEAVRETEESLVAVRASLDAMLAAVRDGVSAREIAPRLIARGGDPEREWRVPASFESEREWVESVLVALAELPVGAGYRVEEFVVEPEREGVWHVLRVEFDDAARTEAEFAFLLLGDAFLLGDLES